MAMFGRKVQKQKWGELVQAVYRFYRNLALSQN